MGDQPYINGVAGPSEPAHTSAGATEAVHACQPLPQETSAPTACDNSNLWALITEPGVWSRLLVRDHLNSSDRYALYLTCKAARDMVLVTADSASVFLCVEQQHEGGEEEEEGGEPLRMASLQAVRLALQTRCKLRTHLELDFKSSHLLSFALGVLEAGTTWLDELTINTLSNGERLPAGVLTMAWRCCPNLRALTVSRPPGIPSPKAFPKLQELCVYVTDDLAVLENIYRTVGPYLPQLTQLTICTECWWDRVPTPPPAFLPLLLIPGIIATHLHTLQMIGPLNDTLLGMLLQSAPALQDLTICRIQLETDTHAQAQPPWRVVTTYTLHLSSLARLPQVPGLEVKLHATVGFPPTLVCDVTSIGEAAAARLKGDDWCCCNSVRIKPGDGVPVADQAAALRVGLNLVHTWPRQDMAIELCGWVMAREVVLELRQLPGFVHEINFHRDLVWLEQPDLYNTLLRLLPDSIHGVMIHQSFLAAGLVTDAQVTSICLGAPGRAPGQAPMTISLPSSAPELVQAIQHTMQQGIYPATRVAGWPMYS